MPVQLNHKVFGRGRPVIILHGMLGTLDNWQTIARKLSENYMVFIVDLRNHGRSPHTPEHSYPLMAEDVHAFMEENWIHEAVVIGHSMGGKVAMQLALEYPDMIEQLIVVDIAPKAYVGNHETIFKALLGLDLKKLKNRKEADAFLQTLVPEFGVRQFLLKNLHINKDTQQYSWKMNLHAIHNAYRHILGHESSDATFDNPTLFVKGGRSNYIDNNELNNYKNNFPDASIVEIKGAGHWIHADKPKDFLQIVEQFLES